MVSDAQKSWDVALGLRCIQDPVWYGNNAMILHIPVTPSRCSDRSQPVTSVQTSQRRVPSQPTCGLGNRLRCPSPAQLDSFRPSLAKS
jgi:hypothetical protein